MRAIAPLLLLSAAVILIAATQRAAAPRADLVIADRGDIFTLDPQRMSYLRDCRVAYALYEGLVTWNIDDFSIVPAAATHWHRSDDQRTWTFHLRTDAQWSNGAPVTAHDFHYSLRRLLLPDTAADYSNLLFVIEGAREFFTWRTEQLTALASAEYADNDARTAAAHNAWTDACARFNETVGIRTPDDHTLVLQLERPVDYLLDVLAFAVCSPVYQPAVEGWPSDWNSNDEPPFDQRKFLALNPATGRVKQDHQWARPNTLVGNGPYRLQDWRYKRDIRFHRSNTYHSPHLAHADTIAILTIEHANTRVLSFESGAVDWLSSVGVDYEPDMLAQRAAYIERHQTRYDALIEEGIDPIAALAHLPPPAAGERRDIHALPTFGVRFFNFNCRPELGNGRANPFADPNVRRAFAQSIDRHAIVRDITRLNEPVIDSFIPPHSIPGYTVATTRFNQPDNAKSQLRDAGWIDRDNDGFIESANGTPFPAVEFVYPSDNAHDRWIALELRQQWQQTLGVNVELRAVDTKFFKEELRNGDYMISPARWYGDYGDPTTFLDIHRADDGNNDRGYDNPAYDELLNQAALEPDPAARFQLLHDAETLLLNDAPFMVLCQLVQTYMFDPSRIQGLCVHPRLTHQLQRIQRADATEDQTVGSDKP